MYCYSRLLTSSLFRHVDTRLFPYRGAGLRRDFSGGPTPTLLHLRVGFAPGAWQTKLIHVGRPGRQKEVTEQVKDKNSSGTKPSSKIEETVNRLKEKKEDQRTKTSGQENVKGVPGVPGVTPAPLAIPDEKKLAETKKSLWIRFVDEVKHFYSGFKLLVLDVNICSKIVFKVLRGETLTRRENRQLVRTVSDLFRLVPFSVFIIVPFMEVLLPVALKLFPGMLPSTFATTSDRENKMRRTLQAKLQYAKFLQKTLDEMAPSSDNRSSKSARDFVEFFREVKEKGIAVSNADIKKFSKLFEDEITLDNMERQQLKALCRLLELTPVGTNNFLRFQLELKLRQLKIDDKVIQREGLDNLDVDELQAACKERGMRAYGMSEKMMRQQLEQWLDLSLNASIPPSLLLLSRTLYLPETLDATAQIAATISSLPESTANVATAQIGEREGKIRNVQRLELIKEEQRKIEEEEKEEKESKEEEEKKKKETVVAMADDITDRIVDKVTRLEEKAKKIESIVGSAEQKIPEVTATTVDKIIRDTVIIAAKAKDQDQVGDESKSESDSKKKDVEITAQDLSDLESAIKHLGKADTEEEEILDLKKELQDYEEDLEELKFIKAEAGRFDLKESTGARRLFKKVNSMLGKVDGLVASLQQKEKAISEAISKAEKNKEELAKDEEKLITIHELIDAVHMLQKTPDSAKVEQIAEVLKRIDFDSDGVIKVDDVLSVIELLGQEHDKLSSKQLTAIIDMLEKEEMLAMESNIEKVLVKLPPDHTEESGSEDSVTKTLSHTETMSRKEDLTEQEPEEHIKEMFRKDEDEKAKMKADENGSKKKPMDLK